MGPAEAIKIVNEKFTYKTDKENFGFRDVWRIMAKDEMVGDCEDYALTVLWLMADKSVPKMLWWLLIRKFRIHHYTHRERGTGHIGLRYGKGAYVDNISRKWNDGSILETEGYDRWKLAWPVTAIILKFIVGEAGHRIAKLAD